MKKDEIYPSKLITPAALMKSDRLTSEQKERFEKEFITTKAGPLKLQKVSRDTASQMKDVEGNVLQCETNEVSLMFGDVAETKVEESAPEISFQSSAIF